MTAIQFINVSPEELVRIIGNVVEEKLRIQLKQLTPSDDDELLTHEEAAKYLRIGKNTLHRYKEAELIKFHRTGNRLKYKISDLKDFLKLQSIKGSQRVSKS